MPEPPSYLSPGALAIWNYTAPLLLEAGRVALLDRGTLASYCDQEARRVAAEEVLAANGAIYETRTDRSGGLLLRARPEVRIASEAARLALALATALGLSPAGRERLTSTPPGPPRPATPSMLDE